MPFSMDSSAGDVFSLVVLPNFRAQKPLAADFRSTLLPVWSGSGGSVSTSRSVCWRGILPLVLPSVH